MKLELRYVAGGLAPDTYFGVTGGPGKVAHDNTTTPHEVLACGKYDNGTGEACARCFDSVKAPQAFSASLANDGDPK